jgi:hypothetical protein
MTVQRKKCVGAVATVPTVSARVCRCVAVGISTAYPKSGIAGSWLRANSAYFLLCHKDCRGRRQYYRLPLFQFQNTEKHNDYNVSEGYIFGTILRNVFQNKLFLFQKEKH